jgi:hypothetical protein
MKNLITIILGLFILFGCASTQGQNKNLEEVIQEIVKTYSDKDTNKLNQYIHKSEGLFVMTTIGTNTVWQNVDEICLEKVCLNEFPDRNLGSPYQFFLESYTYGNKNLNEIEYTDNPYFECEKVEKQGIFVAAKNNYHALSDAIHIYRENFLNINGPTEGIDKIYQELDDLKIEVKNIEKNSHRVVVNSEKGTFIFYITNLDGKWYLSIIDFASIDCSV